MGENVPRDVLMDRATLWNVPSNEACFFLLRFSTPEASLTGNGLSFLLFITATAITTLGRVESSTNGPPGGAYGMDHRHHTHTHTHTHTHFHFDEPHERLENGSESFRHGTSPLSSNPHPTIRAGKRSTCVSLFVCLCVGGGFHSICYFNFPKGNTEGCSGGCSH